MTVEILSPQQRTDMDKWSFIAVSAEELLGGHPETSMLPPGSQDTGSTGFQESMNTDSEQIMGTDATGRMKSETHQTVNGESVLKSQSTDKEEVKKESKDPTRIIVDTELFKQLLVCAQCNGKKVEIQVQQRGSGPSPTMKVKCQDCAHTCNVETSPKMKFTQHRTTCNSTSIYVMCAVIFCGLSYTKVCVLKKCYSLSDEEVVSAFRSSPSIPFILQRDNCS